MNDSTVPDNADRTDAGNCCVIKDCTVVFHGHASQPGQSTRVGQLRAMRRSILRLHGSSIAWTTSCAWDHLRSFVMMVGGMRQLLTCYRQTILKALVMYCSRLSVCP